MKELINPAHFLAALLYSVLGVCIFIATFVAVDKATPYDLWREIVEKQNRALGIVIGCASIGICLIIAASLIG